MQGIKSRKAAQSPANPNPTYKKDTHKDNNTFFIPILLSIPLTTINLALSHITNQQFDQSISTSDLLLNHIPNHFILLFLLYIQNKFASLLLTKFIMFALCLGSGIACIWITVEDQTFSLMQYTPAVCIKKEFKFYFCEFRWLSFGFIQSTFWI